MTLRGLPFLLKRSEVCAVLGISRWTFAERVRDGGYPLLQWVNDHGTEKVVKPSLEKQLDALVVKA